MTLEARLSQNAKAEGLRVFGVAAQTGTQVTGGRVRKGGEPVPGITFDDGAFDEFLEAGLSAPLVYNHKSFLPPIADNPLLSMEGKNLNFSAELSDTAYNQALVAAVLSGELSGSSVGIKAQPKNYNILKNGTAMVHSAVITDITITERGANPNTFVEAQLMAVDELVERLDKKDEDVVGWFEELNAALKAARTGGPGKARDDIERRLALVKDWRKRIAREVV